MEIPQFNQFFSSDQILNSYKTKKYPNGIEYSGTWENGRKVGEGILTKGQNQIKVKIKDGKIYKCIQVLNIQYLSYKSVTKIQLPSITVTKVQDYYKEVASNITEYFFIHKSGRVLFDGKPCGSCKNIQKLYENYEIFKGKVSTNSYFNFIIDILIDDFRFTGESKGPNIIPNGIIKVYLGDLIFKGVMKGILLCGRCTAKNEIFKVLFDIKLSKWSLPFKVISKVLNFEISMIRSSVYRTYIPQKNGVNVDGALPYMSEILEFINQVDLGLYDIYNTLEKFNISSLIVSYCLIDTTWMLIEKRHKRSVYLEHDKNYNIRKSDEKFLKVLHNNEFYEGGIINGKFDGFGKYFYADGSMYVGEFKENFRDGFGSFKFKDGRVYRGYWKNNLMDGKGSIMSNGFKIYGVWEKNKMVKKNCCILFDLKRIG